LNDTKVMKIDHTGLFESKRCPYIAYPIAVVGAAGAYLPESNTNIICGGYNNTGHTNRCFQFNASYMSWDEVNSLNIPRSYHAMTTIGQNVVTCGGWTSGWKTTSSCEKMTNGKWEMIQPLPTALSNHCMVTIDSSTILVLGGWDDSLRVSNNKTYEYNVVNDEWKVKNIEMPQPRNVHTCFMINNLELMVLNYLSSSSIFDLKKQTWKQGPSLPTTIAGGQFVKSKLGTPYLGYLIGGYGNDVYSSAIYTLKNDISSFEKIGNLNKGRESHVAFLLQEGISDKCNN